MRNISRLSYLLFCMLILAVSCAPQQGLIRQSSIFSSMDSGVLGISQEEFISKHGGPISKDMERLNGDMVQRLYYVEIIDKIKITTRFTFLNDSLIKQSGGRMDFNSELMQDLESDIKRNRLRINRHNK